MQTLCETAWSLIFSEAQKTETGQWKTIQTDQPSSREIPTTDQSEEEWNNLYKTNKTISFLKKSKSSIAKGKLYKKLSLKMSWANHKASWAATNLSREEII